MGKARSRMWVSLATTSLERFVMSQSATGQRLSGLILRLHDGVPYEVRYQIEVDHSWITRQVEIELDNGGRRRLAMIRAVEAKWQLDGQPAPALDGCLDVDLEWSPSTNTLPIRRLADTLGGEQAVKAAWVRLPSLRVEPLEQTYQPIGPRRYLYRAGTFEVEIEVDDESLVTNYAGGWQAVRSGATS
jgi:hypothetical protein